MHGSAEKLWVYILFQNNLSLKTAVTKKSWSFQKTLIFFKKKNLYIFKFFYRVDINKYYFNIFSNKKHFKKNYY